MLKGGEILGRDVEVDLAVVRRRFAQQPRRCAVGAIDRSRQCQVLDLPNGQIAGGRIQHVTAKGADAGPVVEQLLEVLQDERLAGFSNRPHLGRHAQGMVNRAQRVAKPSGQLLLRQLESPLRQGLQQDLMPNCFDFLHGKYGIFRTPSKVTRFHQLFLDAYGSAPTYNRVRPVRPWSNRVRPGGQRPDTGRPACRLPAGEAGPGRDRT